MKKILFQIFLSIFIFLFAASLAAAEIQSIASIKNSTGDIKYSKSENDEYKTLNAKQAMAVPIEQGARMMSCPKTHGTLETIYGANFEFIPDTELQILLHGIRINNGGIWVSYKPVKAPDGNVSFKINTPAGIIGIKGTVFAVTINAETRDTAIQVKEGIVTFETTDKKVIDIESGMKLEIKNGNTDAKVEKFSPALDIVAQKNMKNTTGDHVKETIQTSGENEIIKNLELPFDKYKGKDPDNK